MSAKSIKAGASRRKVGNVRAPRKPKVSPTRKPENMTLEEWQIALRRQAAATETFAVRPVDIRQGYFKVNSALKRRVYDVVFRGVGCTWNYCSCPDFRTNRLGTCKHLEAVAIADGGKYASKRYTVPDCTSIYLDYKGERRVRMRSGGAHAEQIRELAAGYFNGSGTLLPDAFGRFGDFLLKAKEIDPATRCFDDAMDFILDRRASSVRNKIADSERHLTEDLLKVPLYPYQRVGVEFAFRRGRALIADDMGLGKTIQAIGTAELLRKHGMAASVWIICPTSLKYQWKKEIEKFTDSTASVVEGNQTRRNGLLEADDAFYKIVSYQSLVNNIRYGLKVMPDMVIYDEVQRLKNWDTKMAIAMRMLKSEYVVALSGTPLENKLGELYSVMQLVDQYCLGPYWQFVDFTTLTDDTGRITGYHNLNKIGEVLRHTLIRRLKSHVRLQMPQRTDKVLYVPMTDKQKAIHDDAKWNMSILIHRWRRFGFLSEKDRQRMLRYLSIMRMAADSTFIIDQQSRNDTKIDEALNIIREVIESGDEKILIFSQWERMQRVMSQELEKAGVGHCFLHGGVPSEKRGRLIADFIENPDCRVFLSTDAGSTGLNLQAASIVINLDLPWNPAVLEQRIARAFRLGQERPVQVINMVSVDSIEQNMLGTLAFKSGMATGVLDGGEDSVVLDNKKFDKIATMVEETMDDDTSDIPSGSEPAEEMTVSDVTHDGDEEDTMNLPRREEQPSLFDEEDYPDVGQQSEELPKSEPESTNVSEAEDIPEVDEDIADKTEPSSVTEDSIDDAEPQELVAQGMDFLGKLSRTLADEKARQRLVDTLVKEDPATGQTTLTIPVESKQTVSAFLNLAAAFLTRP